MAASPQLLLYVDEEPQAGTRIWGSLDGGLHFRKLALESTRSGGQLVRLVAGVGSAFAIWGFPTSSGRMACEARGARLDASPDAVPWVVAPSVWTIASSPDSQILLAASCPTSPYAGPSTDRHYHPPLLLPRLLQRSADGGRTFHPVGPDSEVGAITFVGRKALAVLGDGVYESPDLGATWKKLRPLPPDWESSEVGLDDRGETTGIRQCQLWWPDRNKSISLLPGSEASSRNCGWGVLFHQGLAVAYGAQGLAVSAGSRFVTVTQGLPPGPISLAASSGEALYVVAGGRLFVAEHLATLPLGPEAP